ncbi:ATP-binding cassette domain-containing protein [Helicobacter sp. T3_23-1059]
MIKIINAYENNLKNITLHIPVNKLTCITGVSGSGKSSLIYNVIAKESIRIENIDSGNAGLYDFAVKPKVDKISNLPYCEILKQRNIRESISSNVATITGLYDILREEFVKQGKILSPKGKIINKPTLDDILKFIQKFYVDKNYCLYAVVCFEKYGLLELEIELLKKYHIESVLYWTKDKRINERKLSYLEKLGNDCHNILVKIPQANEAKKYTKLALCGFMLDCDGEKLYFDRDFFDIDDGKIYQKKSASLLSFNSTSVDSGRCEKCDGKGIVYGILEKELFNESAISEPDFINLPFHNGYYKYILLDFQKLTQIYKKYNIDSSKNYFEISRESQMIILEEFRKRMQKHITKEPIKLFFDSVVCDKCNGSRLNYKANSIYLFNKNISQFLEMSVDELYLFLKDKKLYHEKIKNILQSLSLATLGYLALKRTTDTLSGGELQRLKLANVLNSKYNNLLYILDEPSCGLHLYDSSKMLFFIKNIVELNNTVIMSEHNRFFIEKSDYVVEFGPDSGKKGGNIIKYNDKFYNLIRHKTKIDLKKVIKINKVSFNNIKNQDFIFPLECFIAVSGVSGSGKTTLVKGVLYHICKQYLKNHILKTQIAKSVEGLNFIRGISIFNQSQINAQTRSIVATFLDIFDNIRDVFANNNNLFDKSYFSFNHKNGQCVKCKGLGELNEVICPYCVGSGYKNEVLNIEYNGFHINELLNTDIESVAEVFKNNTKILTAIYYLKNLRLGHLSLGRKTTTLSGGEAQRLKLAKYLIKNHSQIKKGGFIFIIDEPTSGLDVQNIHYLYKIFDELIKYKNSVICIEHNLDFIKNADFIIDIGRFAGNNGGTNIFSGTFEDFLNCNESITASLFRDKIIDFKCCIPNENKQVKKQYNFDKNCYEVAKFLLGEEHFKIEKIFTNQYCIEGEQDYFFFKTKQDLIDFVKTIAVKAIFFNPYTQELHNYKKVPNKIKKARLILFRKYKVANIENEWQCKIQINDINKAYEYGFGWITILKQDDKLIHLSTRLVSIKNQIIGSRVINQNTFNIYFNACRYCNGKAILNKYDENLIIKNEYLSILDKDFLKFDLNLKLKSTINYFKNEGLFDFSLPYNKLQGEHKHIFWFGFREYVFLKQGGRENALSDYYEWKGLFFYIYQHLSIIQNSEEIKKSKTACICPFCAQGFNKEILYYHYNHKHLLQYLQN